MNAADVKKLPIMRLRQEHAKEVAALEKICFDEPWSAWQCARALEQPAYAAFGILAPRPACEGAYAGAVQLLAYISFYAVASEMEVLNLAVLPGLRRMGAATRLLSVALHAGRKMGIEKVGLEVRESNLAAIGLYSRFGFETHGRRKNYYANGETALVMLLDLTAAPRP